MSIDCQSQKKDYDVLLKILLLGGTREKAALLLRYAKNDFKENTWLLGTDFMTKTEELDGVKVKLQVWGLLFVCYALNTASFGLRTTLCFCRRL